MIVEIFSEKYKIMLYRVDYTLLGLTGKNCMKLLPSTAPKLPQKVKFVHLTYLNVVKETEEIIVETCRRLLLVTRRVLRKYSSSNEAKFK
jgi:hypothetical protein